MTPHELIIVALALINAATAFELIILYNKFRKEKGKRPFIFGLFESYRS